MGFFSSRPKAVEMEPAVVEPETPAEELPSLPTPLTSTVIATGVTVSGTMKGEGVIQVEGAVKGEIILQGAVIITTTGSVQGPVTADVIQIAGDIKGNCVARDHMCLEKTGSLEGDVTTVSLIVHDGGRLNGRSNMVKEIGKDTKAKPAKAAPEDDLEFGRNYKGGEDKK